MIGRERFEGKKPKFVTRPPEPPPAAPEPPKRGKPPVAGTEQVTCLCGHLGQFEIFEDKKDKYRDTRRAKFAGKKCPDCRKQDLEEQIKRQQEGGKERRTRKRAAQRAKRNRDWQRLPHGSFFFGVFDGSKMNWEVILGAVGGGNSFEGFNGDGSGIFPTLERVDKQYRKWVAEGGKLDPPAKLATETAEAIAETIKASLMGWVIAQGDPVPKEESKLENKS